MNNGRYFYQQNYGKGYSRGSYAFKTSNGFHAIRYNMKRQQYYSSFISDLGEYLNYFKDQK